MRPRPGTPRARPLSTLRPLAWRWYLPACAAGLLAGQTLGGRAGEGGVRLALAALFAVPAVAALHRAAGRAALLVAVAATVGAAQAWSRDVRREERLAAVPDVAQFFRGRIRRAETRPGRAGSTWALLEVTLAGEASWYRPGDALRLSLWSAERRWRVGEEVTFRATPRAPRGFCNQSRDAWAELAFRRGIVAQASLARDAGVTLVRPPTSLALDMLLGAARDAIATALERAVPADDEREVLRALVLGDQSRIRAELRDAYAATGTAHVLSVSGLHIALVATSAFFTTRRLLARLPWLALRVPVARAAACLALPPAVAYALLSGGATATLRALVMGAAVLGGVVLGRRSDAWTALAAAALVLALLDPGIAEDPSFQLSFAAVASLVAAARVARRLREVATAHGFDAHRRTHRAFGWLAASVGASLAATIATAPFTAYHFGQVALVGTVANLIAVPLAGWLVVLLGLAGAALVVPWPDGGETCLRLAAVAVRPVNLLVEALAAAPGASARWALASPLEVGAVLALVASPLVGAARLRRALVVAAGVALGLHGCAGRLAASTAPLVVRFLDVGQGDASIVQLASEGRTIVVDGGGLAGSFDPGERIVLPALRRARVARVAALVVSHPEHDHYAGLAAVPPALRVDELWWTGRTTRAASFARLMDAVAAHGVAKRTLAAGDAPGPWRATPLVRVLHPPGEAEGLSQNDASLVLEVRYGASRVLFTGDVEAAGEALLRRSAPGLTATVIKVPHHGSRTSSARSLLARLRPSLAVAMLGAHNRFWFPAPEVRQRYRWLGAAWRQTDAAGEVVVASDGQLERVTTCRAG